MTEKTINIYILSGFLGAGKTTTLKHLLKNSFLANARTALIINEFGKIGVDAKLIDTSHNKTYEINKGSIFCSCTHKDFIDILQQITSDNITDNVLIEATGITEICDLEKLIDLSNTNNVFKIKGNICLVDAANFTKVAPYVKAATNQVIYSDTVIINKTDLINQTDLQKLKLLLKEINPSTTITSTSYGILSDDFLLNLKHTKHDSKTIQNPPEHIIAIGINSEKVFNKTDFINAVEKINKNILRIKGNIKFQDQTNFVELVGHDLLFHEPCNNLSPTQFTIITYGIKKETVENVFQIH